MLKDMHFPFTFRKVQANNETTNYSFEVCTLELQGVWPYDITANYVTEIVSQLGLTLFHIKLSKEICCSRR